MSLLRPVRVTPDGRYGLITQDFRGTFSWEQPGYIRTDFPIDRGARFRFSLRARKLAHIHLGIDYSVAVGTPVRAVHSGKIIAQGKDGTGAYYIYQQVRVGRVFKIVAVYYHLKAASFRFRKGDFVVAGQTIALSGNTGWSTGPHLHFGLMRVLRGTLIRLMWRLAVWFDPQPFISGGFNLGRIAP